MANGFSASQVAGAEFASAAAAYGVPNAGEYTALAHLQAVTASMLNVGVLGGFCANVMDPRFGAVGDGLTDDTAAIEAALAAADAVAVPAGRTLACRDVQVPSDKTLLVLGTLRMLANSPVGSVILTNDDHVGGNTNIRVLGTGKLDGNKANQTGATEAVWHSLVKLVNCTYSEVSGVRCTGNYFPRAISSTFSTGAVYLKDCTYCVVRDITLTDYAREGFWCENCDHTQMLDLMAIGGADSYSGMQFSGSYNTGANWVSKGAGASGFSFDCQDSTLTNATVEGNSFQNAVNFGHDGIPASRSVASNIAVKNAAQDGISIAASTEDFTLTGFSVDGAVGEGVRASDNSTRITIAKGTVDGAGTHGLQLFSALGVASALFWVSNIVLRNSTLYGIVIDGVTATFNNVTLDGYGSGPLNRLNSAVENMTQCRLSLADPVVDAPSVSGSAGDYTVTNVNVRQNSRIVMIPGNANGFNAQPYISAVNDGNFVITTLAAGGSGAFVRYWIV